MLLTGPVSTGRDTVRYLRHRLIGFPSWQLWSGNKPGCFEKIRYLKEKRWLSEFQKGMTGSKKEKSLNATQQQRLLSQLTQLTTPATKTSLGRGGQISKKKASRPA